jgi:hypothetical protein
MRSLVGQSASANRKAVLIESFRAIRSASAFGVVRPPACAYFFVGSLPMHHLTALLLLRSNAQTILQVKAVKKIKKVGL